MEMVWRSKGEENDEKISLFAAAPSQCEKPGREILISAARLLSGGNLRGAPRRCLPGCSNTALIMTGLGRPWWQLKSGVSVWWEGFGDRIWCLGLAGGIWWDSVGDEALASSSKAGW